MSETGPADVIRRTVLLEVHLVAGVILKGIGKVYPGGVRAVTDFNLKIKNKEFIVFVGPSGCGKSTTLRMIAGLEEISEGELYIDDRLVNDIPPKDRDIAMVFQNYALYPHMTVEKNISYGLKNMKVPKDEIKKKTEWAIDILGLEEYRNRKPKNLSGGQRQRVCIARALMLMPSLVVADEPIASLDVSIQAQIIMLFKHLQKEHGFSMLFIAHDLSAVRFVSNRIGVMLKGKLVELAETEELFNNPIHPYTMSLLSSIHIPDPIYERNRVHIDYDKDTPLGETLVEKSKGHFVLE